MPLCAFLLNPQKHYTFYFATEFQNMIYLEFYSIWNFQIVFFYLWGCIYISSEYFNGLILLDLIMILCKIIPLSKYKSSMWWYWRWGLLEVIGFWSGHEVWIVSPFMKRNRASSLLTCTKSRTVFFRQSQDLVSDDDLLATKLLKTTLIFIAG